MKTFAWLFLFCTLSLADTGASFSVGPRGPHGGTLLRATPRGPHKEISGYYERLYFELVPKGQEVDFYTFVVPPNQKGVLVPASPEKELSEYRVVARSPRTKFEVKLSAYRADGSIQAMFGINELQRLEMKRGDPCILVVTVIHESISKEAVFGNYLAGETL